MILVVGLAIAGIVGIAAAFYFSIRSGRGGDKRLRSARAGRAGIDRRPGSRSGGTARSDRTDNARRAANGHRPANTGRGANASSRNYRADDSTGPNPVLDFGDPVLVGGRRGGPGTSTGDPQATNPRLAAAVPDESRPAESRPRRRVGFRKGADVDEELWPAESFGGVSDEQFWNDLASDKPLTTTARTAQQDPGARNRPFEAAPPTAARPSASRPSASRPSAARPSAARPPVPGPPAATQPVQNMKSQGPGATQPVRAATGPSPLRSASSQPVNVSGQPVNVSGQPVSVGQPVNAPSQPVSAAAPPAEPRGRRRASRSDDEDPLTSAAFSLRSSGPVDGRSSRRSRDTTSDQYDPVAQETQTFSAAETEAASGGYPGGVPTFRQPESSAGGRSSSSVTQAMNTPPYGETYGHGSGGSPAQPDDPRRQNGTRSHARHSGTGEATRAARQTYSQDAYQGTGGYPADGYPGTGSYQAGGYPTGGYPTGGYPDGGHQGNGHQTGSYPNSAQQGNANGYRGNGHRAPYDPRDDYRRLTHLG